MTISSAKVLGAFYNAAKAIGTKSINSDAYFEVEGHEHLGLMTKQFPWPTIGSQGEIEVSMPLGGKTWLGQQINTAQQGPLTMTETVGGIVMQFMKAITTNNAGGEFNATVYEGVPDKFTRAYKLRGCIFVPDAVDRDWENRAQLTLINGTLFYNWFGEELTPNSPVQ